MLKNCFIASVSCLAAVLSASSHVSAQNTRYASYTSLLERLETVEAQLASATMDTGPTGDLGGCDSYGSGCQTCGSDCGCCCPGRLVADAEVLFLRYHESDGVDESPPDDEFGFDPAWRESWS